MNGLSFGQISADDIHAGIVAVRMNGDQPAAGTERACQRRDHALGLEIERSARAIGLRGDDQIVIGDRAARLRNDRIEQEFVVFAIDHQHDRALIDRVAGLGADSRLPVLRQERFEIGDLLLEAVGRVAGERQLVPDQARRGAHRFDRQPRRIRIGQVGEHQHGRRVFEEPVGHLLQREPDILEADLLADHIERHGRRAVVHGAHHAREHGAVADAGIEHAHRRRARMDVGEFQPDALADHPFFAAGVDEQQILLPVVEETEIALRIARRLRSTG